jgi:Uma2 family endonuclease
MAETPLHRMNMTDVIAMLEERFAAEDDVYVSGNMLMYYVPGNRHMDVSPDVFFVRGVPKNKPRKYYLVWEERPPQCVIELTSQSTQEEDLIDKRQIYEETIRVEEYFLFDPYGEYLNPVLQGFRLIDGAYVPIDPVEGRLPSETLGLHLEANGCWLRLYDPRQGEWLPTPKEARDEAEAAQREAETARREAETARREAETARSKAEAAWRQEQAARHEAEGKVRQAELDRQAAEAALQAQQAEAERLRQRLAELQQKLPPE